VTDNETKIAWVAAGLGGIEGRTTLTVAEAVGFNELMHAANYGDSSNCLKSTEDREFLFSENYTLLMEYAVEKANTLRTSRLKWLAAIKYDGIPEDVILSEVQAGLVYNKPTPYHTELINGFIGHLITEIINSITAT
jgi:hypothetical protein